MLTKSLKFYQYRDAYGAKRWRTYLGAETVVCQECTWRECYRLRWTGTAISGGGDCEDEIAAMFQAAVLGVAFQCRHDDTPSLMHSSFLCGWRTHHDIDPETEVFEPELICTESGGDGVYWYEPQAFIAYTNGDDFRFRIRAVWVVSATQPAAKSWKQIASPQTTNAGWEGRIQNEALTLPDCQEQPVFSVAYPFGSPWDSWYWPSLFGVGTEFTDSVVTCETA